MVSPTNVTKFFNEFISVLEVEKENKFLIGSRQFFFLSLIAEKEIMTISTKTLKIEIRDW